MVTPFSPFWTPTTSYFGLEKKGGLKLLLASSVLSFLYPHQELFFFSQSQSNKQQTTDPLATTGTCGHHPASKQKCKPDDTGAPGAHQHGSGRAVTLEATSHLWFI